MEAKVAQGVSSAGEGKLLALVIWLIPLVVIVIGARRWLPELASEHGAGIDVMLNYLFVTVGGLLTIGHIAFGYFLGRFSGKPNVTHRLSSPKAERRWSLIPIVLMTVVAEGGVFVLGLPVWAKFYGDRHAVNLGMPFAVQGPLPTAQQQPVKVDTLPDQIDSSTESKE